MPSSEAIKLEGVVVDINNSTFKVELSNGHIVEAYVAGRLRQRHIDILEGDKVYVELSPYDINNGRIVYNLSRGNTFKRSK